MADELLGLFGKDLENALTEHITKFVEQLKEVYLDSYNKVFQDFNVDTESLANPLKFYDEYKKALDDFTYLGEISELGDLHINIPTEDTFNFSGRLKSLQLIINGVLGSYYELPYTDIEYLVSVAKLSKQAVEDITSLPEFFDSETNVEERFYLIHAESYLPKVISNILRKDLVEFPFSNTAPIDIFDEGITYFENNIDSVIHTALNTATTNINRG